MKLKEIRDRQLGVMFGLAYGDALGRPTEFLKTPGLKKLGNPFNERIGLNRPHLGIVTDDTQMSIAVARAASDPVRLTPATWAARFVAEFIRWDLDPKSHDGKRAPGATCMGAVGALRRNPGQWLLASRSGSKGNGANMRVSPLALRTDLSWNQLGALAQLQAAITHGHPTALAAADLTAVAVRMLLEGVAEPTENLLDHLLAYAHDQRLRYHGDYLGSLWESGMLDQVYSPVPKGFDAAPGKLMWWEDADPNFEPKPKLRPKIARSPQDFIQRGWDEVINSLLSIHHKPRMRHQDPCDLAGGGWTAEQALSGALHALLCFPGDPANVLRRAAFTDGDSDSIASIAGALAGAAYGRKAFPSHWIPNLEYRYELEGLAMALAAVARGC